MLKKIKIIMDSHHKLNIHLRIFFQNHPFLNSFIKFLLKPRSKTNLLMLMIEVFLMK
jgi:hypothetical protein